MGILTPLVSAGLTATIAEDGRLQIWGNIDALAPEQAEQVYGYIKQNKDRIIAALSQAGRPGECESCPAAGYWDHAQYAGKGLLCFHYAYYLGKPGKPKPCGQTRAACPRK